MNSRLQKQLMVGLVFLLILGGIGYGIYAGLVTRASCADGIQNGKEEGVDCGSLACGKTCEPAIMPMVVISSQVFNVGHDQVRLMFFFQSGQNGGDCFSARFADDVAENQEFHISGRILSHAYRG